LEKVKEHTLKVNYILDTHMHADHITGGNYMRTKLGVGYGIGRRCNRFSKD